MRLKPRFEHTFCFGTLLAHWKRKIAFKVISQECDFSLQSLVPRAGLEPARPIRTTDFKSVASTDSAITASAVPFSNSAKRSIRSLTLERQLKKSDYKVKRHLDFTF
jgi:hypothetical protein